MSLRVAVESDSDPEDLATEGVYDHSARRRRRLRAGGRWIERSAILEKSQDPPRAVVTQTMMKR